VNILSVFRMGVLFLIVVIFIRMLLSSKKKKTQEEQLDQFEKNEEGLYPWEVNTDDDPSHIPTNAKPFVEQDKIKRGRW